MVQISKAFVGMRFLLAEWETSCVGKIDWKVFGSEHEIGKMISFFLEYLPTYFITLPRGPYWATFISTKLSIKNIGQNHYFKNPNKKNLKENKNCLFDPHTHAYK